MFLTARRREQEALQGERRRLGARRAAMAEEVHLLGLAADDAQADALRADIAEIEDDIEELRSYKRPSWAAIGRLVRSGDVASVEAALSQRKDAERLLAAILPEPPPPPPAPVIAAGSVLFQQRYDGYPMTRGTAKDVRRTRHDVREKLKVLARVRGVSFEWAAADGYPHGPRFNFERRLFLLEWLPADVMASTHKKYKMVRTQGIN